MATDSTELTFVRCPSCRSLVPAVSTRCRMCGASLEPEEAAAAEQPAQADEGAGRVRQRTMSKPKSELSNTVNKIREEISQAEDELEAEAPETDTFESQGGEDEIADPLGDYIEELPDDEFEAAEELSTEISTAKGEEVAFDDDDSSEEDPQPAPPAPEENLNNGPRVASPEREEVAPVVRMEPGGKGRNEGRGLSFGKKDSQSRQSQRNEQSRGGEKRQAEGSGSHRSEKTG